jgi:hypothetical protein
MGLLAIPHRGALVRTTATELYVAGTRSSVAAIEPNTLDVIAGATPVSYGLHVADGAELRVERDVVLGGGYGFYNAGGAFALAGGVISGRLDAAGAVRATGDLPRTTLDEVALVGGSHNAAVVDATLAPGAALPTPTLPCTTSECL